MIRRLRLVSVPVSDPTRARDFYMKQLGFEAREDEPMGESHRWMELAPPGAETGITLVTWFPTMQPGSLKGLVIDTPDISAEYAELKNRGVQFKGEIQTQDWGTFAEFADPDGNGWVLMQG